MSDLDVSKLTPAPWHAEGGEVFRRDPFLYLLPHDSPHGYAYDRDRREADLAFIALARNAADVMVRRGWGVTSTPNGWAVTLEGAYCGSQGLYNAGWQGWADDPFTVLVTADEWYRVNVKDVE